MTENTGIGKGILGAVIGCIPGLLLWILLGYLNITAAICGFVLAIGIILGFQFFSGNWNKAGIIVCIGCLLLSVFVGEYLSWALVLQREFKAEDIDISLTSCVVDLFSYLEILEIKGSFFGSLAKGYLFAFIGAGGTLGKLLKG